MKAAHHPGIHFGPINVDWSALIVPLGTILMLVVARLFFAGGAGAVETSVLMNPIFGP